MIPSLFNSQHSPIGSLASFTLGSRGAKGGFDLEQGKPSNQSVFIGLESRDKSHYDALPFYEDIEDASVRFDVDRVAGKKGGQPILCPVQNVARTFKAGSDTFRAGDLTFTIYTQTNPVTNPSSRDDCTLKLDIWPGLLAEITVDNTQCTMSRRGFFGYEGTDPYCGMRRLDDTSKDVLTGIGQGGMTAIATNDKGVRSGLGFTMESILAESLPENLAFALGNIGALLFDVPAGAKVTYSFVLCFYRQGIVTSGIKASYYYTKFFHDIDAVCKYGLEHQEKLLSRSHKANEELECHSLSEDQLFLLSQSIHSYYGSTQLLLSDGKPIWTVWEGEYRMINTFDLTVDQLFYEIRKNPWTVANELEQYYTRYSYNAKVHIPSDETEHQGGISFTHDMGMGNVFTRPGFSSYERQGLHGCFSYMTAEQLANWVLCAAVYITQTKDENFYQRYEGVLRDCLTSMLHRDHPIPNLRNGMVQLDSCRANGGSEITTYDSLDESLGQARNNLYLAGKYFAAYVSLEKLFSTHRQDCLATLAKIQAELCGKTIAEHQLPDGHIPAVFENGNDSKIIPAIEGLAFLPFTGCSDALSENGPYASYILALKGHMRAIMQPGICLFADHSWKLSSSSDISWLSKVFLCQYVTRNLLDLKEIADQIPAADAAHVNWLVNEKSEYWCFSDQFVDKTAIGSKFYPRGVTSILWLYETD